MRDARGVSVKRRLTRPLLPASSSPPAPQKAYDDNLAIKVTDLHFTYATRDGDRYVLKGLNMNLERGSRCLLIGANGAGKVRIHVVVTPKSPSE